MVVLAALLFLIFQAVFSWAAVPMDWIDAGVAALGDVVAGLLPEGPLQSLLVDGVIAGRRQRVMFLPQILILFLFILALEDSGYLPRAAFLLDRVMGSVGLSGRAFIPLLSSFACAIPGIMATRTIPNLRDRIATIMIAPLMTCSARLPVYALLIAAFIPASRRSARSTCRASCCSRCTSPASSPRCGRLGAQAQRRRRDRPLLLELPDYHWPSCATCHRPVGARRSSCAASAASSSR
jgi:ferrous iron transport protein B